jgi:UTP--glucose-1-phosphate uridylyltransferase
MLGDDIMDEHSTVLVDMIGVYADTGASVVAFKSFPPEEISSYGCADPEPTDRPDLVRLRGIVEKPKPEDAPSGLAVMGRYLFTREIFDALDRTKPGVGGEIQLTDAIAILLTEQPVYGFVFDEGRFDIGKKLDYLRATVELALDRDDLAPEFREYLAEVVRRRGIV